MKDVSERVRKTVIEALMLDESMRNIREDDDLREKLGLDSVGFLEVLTALEEEFNIEFPEGSISRHSASTIAKLASLVVQSQDSGG